MGHPNFCFISSKFVFIPPSIGTISFCWREYGELSTLHTDATSIIFVICESRWIFRIVSGLVFLTSLSLPIMTQLRHTVLPNAPYWAFGLTSTAFVSSIIGYALNFCVSHHRVPWLKDKCVEDIIKDKTDNWKYGLFKEDFEVVKVPTKNKFQKYGPPTVQIFAFILCLFGYILSLTMNIGSLTNLLMNHRPNASEMYVIVSVIASLAIESGAIVFLLIRCKILNKERKELGGNLCNMDHKKPWVPYHIWMMAPYALVCSLRHFLEGGGCGFFFECNDLNKETYISYIHWVFGILGLIGYLYLSFGLFINFKYIISFLLRNFTNHQEFGSRKLIRTLDTAGSTFLLVGMVLGISSIFIDHYDVVFTPDGALLDIVDAVKDFQDNFESVKYQLKNIADNLKVLKKEITCKETYEILGAATGIGKDHTF